jgi:hypothetical protein
VAGAARHLWTLAIAAVRRVHKFCAQRRRRARTIQAAPRRTPRFAWLHRSHDRPSLTAYSVAVAARRHFRRQRKPAGSEKCAAGVVLRAAGAKSAPLVAGARALPRRSLRFRAAARPLRGVRFVAALPSVAAVARRSALAAALSGGPGAARHRHALRVAASIPSRRLPRSARARGRSARHATRREKAAARVAQRKGRRGIPRPAHSEPRDARPRRNWRGVSARRAEATAEQRGQPTA